MLLYCPALHHIAKLQGPCNPHTSACATKCVEAAIQAVRTAEALDSQSSFYEAHALTVDVLAMAATALLVAQLRASTGVGEANIQRTSGLARTLLERLAQHNSAASQCLESLTVSKAISTRYILSFGASSETPRQLLT